MVAGASRVMVDEVVIAEPSRLVKQFGLARRHA
jgi:hypothetical protein